MKMKKKKIIIKKERIQKLFMKVALQDQELKKIRKEKKVKEPLKLKIMKMEIIIMRIKRKKRKK